MPQSTARITSYNVCYTKLLRFGSESLTVLSALLPELARERLEEPDVRDGHGQLDVPHALAPHLGQRHFHTAAVADDAAVADPLVLAAVTFPVLDRTENPLAEELV